MWSVVIRMHPVQIFPIMAVGETVRKEKKRSVRIDRVEEVSTVHDEFTAELTPSGWMKRDKM